MPMEPSPSPAAMWRARVASVACRSSARLTDPVYDTRVRSTVGVATLLIVSAIARIAAHDLEGTQVVLTFARDGSFVLDVSNDPSWLKLRLEPFRNNFVDRVVLFVDGHEVRPTSVEYIAGETAGTYRLR